MGEPGEGRREVLSGCRQPTSWADELCSGIPGVRVKGDDGWWVGVGVGVGIGARPRVSWREMVANERMVYGGKTLGEVNACRAFSRG